MDLLNSLFLLILALSAVAANSICPGAPPSAYGNGILDCEPPSCTAAGSDLIPSPDPTKFFQCAGPGFSAEMKCAPGTCFSLQFQVCVHPRDWTDSCQRLVATPEPEYTEDTTTDWPFDEETTIDSTEEILSTTEPEDMWPNEEGAGPQNAPGSNILNAINRIPNTLFDMLYRVISWPWS